MSHGSRYAVEGIFVVQGEILACNLAPGVTLQQEIDAMWAAYQVNGQTLGLYNDNNTLTSHYLSSTATGLVDGPWIEKISFPEGDRSELATHRSYYIEAHAIYDSGDAGINTFIMEYHESLQWIGLGGPAWDGRYDQDSVWVPQVIVPATPTRLIQSGWSKGWGGYVLPLPPVSPLDVHWDRAVEKQDSPTHGSAKTKEYGMRWMYPMTLATWQYWQPLSK